MSDDLRGSPDFLRPSEETFTDIARGVKASALGFKVVKGRIPGRGVGAKSGMDALGVSSCIGKGTRFAAICSLKTAGVGVDCSGGSIDGIALRW